MLHIIPTPVGNRHDMTYRAVTTLQTLSTFLCEDTRTSKKICQLYNIDITTKKFYPFDSYTSGKQIEHLMKLLKKEEIGLLSEAGTPGLSDPGKVLIQHCVQYGVPYTILPGANALVPAIVGAGFPTHRFQFRGFLPNKKGRQTMIRAMVESEIPVFIYESVYRVEKFLTELATAGFTGLVSIAREVSKMHEQYITTDIASMQQKIQAKEIPLKGEFVIGICPDSYFQAEIKQNMP